MYEWKRLGRLLAPAVLAVALPGAAWAANCVNFDGVEHCAIGNAQLTSTSSGLQITNFGASGSDGVAFQIPGATSWTVSSAIQGNSAATTRLVSTAVADGAPTSSMILQQNGGSVTVSATFTGAGRGATYSALIYKDGVFQGGGGGIPSGQMAMMINRTNPINNPDPPRPDPWPWWWWWWWFHDFGFSIVSSTGGCSHTFSTSMPWSFTLADGRSVIGNRVDLVEDVPGSGSYPYLSFDAMQSQGTPGSLTIQSESVKQ